MKKEKRKLTFILLIIVLFIGAFLAYQSSKPKEVTNFEFEDEQQKPESETNEAGVTPGIEIPGYKSIVIPSGTKNVKVELTNPEKNNVYFEISFYLPESDEVIYTSKLIKPGQSIYDIELEHEMEAGEYPLIVKYATYSADENKTPRNGAEVNCTLVVNE